MSETDRAAEAADREYFTAIETEFIRRRGSPFLLSPKDYALIRRWRELGIPAADVRLGIADAFDRRAERGAMSRINSVSYCEGAVLEAWERGASARVGKGESRPEDRDTPRELEALAATLLRAGEQAPPAAEPLSRAEASVRKLASSKRNPEQIESALGRIEKKLLKEIGASLAENDRRSMEEEIDRRLGADRERMESRAFERTRDVLIRRSLRSRFGLPRLSLLA